MWGTPSSRASRLLVAGWAVFAAINIAAMFAMPGDETIPFHLVWISLALVYGLRPWRVAYVLATLAVIAGTTLWALIDNVRAGDIGVEETTEVPLMSAMLLVMVWHVIRRQAALRQVELLAERERRRAEAQQLFVQVSSHELRTPITIARGYTELIRAAHSDPETDEDTGIVLDELAKLERITGRLLTLMLADAADPPPVGDLDEALERVMHRWVPAAPRRWLVESHVGRVVFDPDHLETVLDSLLENAVKFTEKHDVISLRAWKESSEVLVEVRDTGRGIPTDELHLIFEYFATGRTAGGRAGTGLGLPIVRAMVGARGGTVEVSSEPGQGATFLLRIPEQPPLVPLMAYPVQDVAVALPARRPTDLPHSPA